MNNLIESLKKDEGFLPKAKNLKPKSGRKEVSIGYGYNLATANDPVNDLLRAGVNPRDVKALMNGEMEITQEQANRLLHISINQAKTEAEQVVPNLYELPGPVQEVVLNMAYQLGGTGLKGFTNMRGALAEGDYEKAAAEILNSDLARRDTPERAKRHADKLIEFANSQENKQQQSARQETRKLTDKQRTEALVQQKRQALIKKASQMYRPDNKVHRYADKVRTMMLSQAEQTETKQPDEDDTVEK